MFLLFAEGGGVQIVPDLSMFVHMGIILVMIWILNKTFFKPVNKVLMSRDGTGGRETESEGMLLKAAEKEEKYKDALLEARNEGYDLVESQRNEAMAAKQEKVASAKVAIRESTDESLKELDDKVRDAELKIRDEAVSLADKISANIVKAG